MIKKRPTTFNARCCARSCDLVTVKLLGRSHAHSYLSLMFAESSVIPTPLEESSCGWKSKTLPEAFVSPACLNSLLGNFDISPHSLRDRRNYCSLSRLSHSFAFRVGPDISQQYSISTCRRRNQNIRSVCPMHRIFMSECDK